jgi:hypothetical protein
MLRGSVRSAITKRARWARVDGFGEIPIRRFLEVEHDRQVVVFAEGIPKGIECSLAFGCETTEDQDGFGGDGIDNVADSAVIEKQIDELRNLQVVYRNLGWSSGVMIRLV